MQSKAVPCRQDNYYTSYPSIRPLRKVSRNNLTSILKRLYTVSVAMEHRKLELTISVNGSHGTSYRRKR